MCWYRRAANHTHTHTRLQWRSESAQGPLSQSHPPSCSETRLPGVTGKGHPPRPGLEAVSKMSRKVPGEGSTLKAPGGTLRMVPQAASRQDGAVRGDERHGLRTRWPPYRSLRALRAQSAPGSVRESVSENWGVPESVWGSALGALQKVT